MRTKRQGRPRMRVRHSRDCSGILGKTSRCWSLPISVSWSLRDAWFYYHCSVDKWWIPYDKGMIWSMDRFNLWHLQSSWPFFQQSEGTLSICLEKRYRYRWGRNFSIKLLKRMCRTMIRLRLVSSCLGWETILRLFTQFVRTTCQWLLGTSCNFWVVCSSFGSSAGNWHCLSSSLRPSFPLDCFFSSKSSRNIKNNTRIVLPLPHLLPLKFSATFELSAHLPTNQSKATTIPHYSRKFSKWEGKNIFTMESCS